MNDEERFAREIAAFAKQLGRKANNIDVIGALMSTAVLIAKADCERNGWNFDPQTTELLRRLLEKLISFQSNPH
jgi:hypothetical protein